MDMPDTDYLFIGGFKSVVKLQELGVRCVVIREKVCLILFSDINFFSTAWKEIYLG